MEIICFLCNNNGCNTEFVLPVGGRLHKQIMIFIFKLPVSLDDLECKKEPVIEGKRLVEITLRPN